MRLLFATSQPYLPDSIGGGLLTMHHMALQLLQDGHDFEVVAKSGPSVRQLVYPLLRQISGSRSAGILEDQQNGYVTHRASVRSVVRELLRERLAAFRPDAVMTQGEGFVELAVEAVNLGYPAIIRLNSAGSVESLRYTMNNNIELKELLKSRHVVLASGSQFIATRVRELLDVESPVINSVIRCSELKVSERKPEVITFVNPCKQKGLEIAIKVAGLLPHRKFLFVESWPLGWVARQKLRMQLRSVPNVQFRPRSLQMKDVYQRTSVLLAPSQWEETFARVIVEAGLNGIPSVASRIGGIPETIGEGGILLAPGDPPGSWAATLERILTDKGLYARLSAKAVLSAARPEVNAEEITRCLLETVRSLNHAPVRRFVQLGLVDDLRQNRPNFRYRYSFGPRALYRKAAVKAISFLRVATGRARLRYNKWKSTARTGPVAERRE